MKKWIIAIFTLLSPMVKGAWFIDQLGIPTVLGNNGDMSAIINYQRDGFLGLYFYSRTRSFPCTGNQTAQIDVVESM